MPNFYFTPPPHLDGTDGGGQNIKKIRRLSWMLSFMTPKRPAYPSLNDGFGEETRQSFWVIFRKNSALITFFYAFAHFSHYFLESFCWNVKDVHSHHVSFIYWTSPLFWKYDNRLVLNFSWTVCLILFMSQQNWKLFPCAKYTRLLIIFSTI